MIDFSKISGPTSLSQWGGGTIDVGGRQAYNPALGQEYIPPAGLRAISMGQPWPAQQAQPTTRTAATTGTPALSNIFTPTFSPSISIGGGFSGTGGGYGGYGGGTGYSGGYGYMPGQYTGMTGDFSTFPTGAGYPSSTPMGFTPGEGQPSGWPWPSQDLTSPGDVEAWRVGSYRENYPEPAYTGAATRPGYIESIPTPPEWDVSGRALAKLAEGTPTDIPKPWEAGAFAAGEAQKTGLPSPVPEIWQRGGGRADIMAETGLPVSQEPWYQQAKAVAETDITDAIKQAAEQAGLTGLRWSTPLGRTAQDIAGRTMARTGLEWTDRELAALEAARQRQMGAMPLQYQFGAGEAGLGEAARGRQMEALPYQYQFGQGMAGLSDAAKTRSLQAAQALGPLGQMYAQLPMDISQQALQTGLATQQAQQAQLAPILQEFLRLTPEASPWTQMAFGATQLPFESAYQQYQPSTMTQGLEAGTGIAGMLALLKLAGVLSSREYKKDITQISQQQEQDIFEKIKDVPLFSYRYKFETGDTTPHIGLITESSPKEVTLLNDKMVGLYEYIASLHAAIKVLTKKVEELGG